MSGLTDARRLVRLARRCPYGGEQAPERGLAAGFRPAAAVVLPSAASVPYCQAN